MGRHVVPEGAQILVDQLTLSQPGGTNYAHHIIIGTPEFSDLPTALLGIKYALRNVVIEDCDLGKPKLN